MMMCDLKPKAISFLLNFYEGFVSKCKVIYEDKGTKGLRLNYKGGKGLLKRLTWMDETWIYIAMTRIMSERLA